MLIIDLAALTGYSWDYYPRSYELISGNILFSQYCPRNEHSSILYINRLSILCLEKFIRTQSELESELEHTRRNSSDRQIELDFNKIHSRLLTFREVFHFELCLSLYVSLYF